MSLTIQGDDFNAPTNPQLTSSSSDFSDGDRIYTAIVKHGGVSVSITGFGGTVTENSNLANTKGFRVKCYDSLTTTGVRFNPTDWDSATQTFTTNDYFVLLYSDSPFQHHFAKITEVKTEDLIGDAFEFEPKLGNEIPKDTKFIIFQVTQNTDIVALSLGMLQDDDAELEDELAIRMSVARPLFYFYDGLDKERELDHNTKYYAMRECGTANTYTLDNTDPSRTFITVQDFGKTVIDYSKFSHRVKLTDKLRDLDAVGTATNEGQTGLVSDTTDYDASYRNARRITDDEINSPTYTGPIRYLHYDFSPTKSNVLYNVYDHVNTESIDGKGGFSETSVIDNARIIPRKIKEFYAYRARHNIHRGDFNAFFPLKATYDSSTSSTVFSFETEYDLGTVLNAGDEVKLGDEILVVDSFGTLSGTTQTITFQNSGGGSPLPYARTELEGAFTAQSITPTSGDILYRRAYNATDKTLLLDTHLLNGRFSKMYVSFISHNHIGRFATVTACDSTKGMITLAFDDDSYNSNPLSFTKGQYQLFIERFDGEIESIESKKENGQSIVEIKGRDKFKKLLSPIVNLNTLFSEDIIYSSSSPYNKLGNIKSGNTYTVALGDTEIDTGIVAGVSYFDNYPVTGTRLFGANGYIGEVVALSLHASVNRKLIITPAITELNSEALYMDIEKNYVLSKSLSSSHLATNKPTSLTGAANKGLIFTAGNEIKAITKSGTTASSSASVTVADTSDLVVGMAVKGHLSIPTGSTIVSIDSSTTITISANATSAFTQDILFFGGEGDSLVANSANTNEGAIGYPINKPSSISNDFAFQTLLKDEYGSAGESSFDTVNTLIDFEVVSTTKKDNNTEIELASYIPVTLGRKTDYYYSQDDLTLTAAGEVNIVSSSSTTFDGFVTTNFSTYTLKRDDIIFVGDSSSSTTSGTKTFVGKIKALVIDSFQVSGGTNTHRQKIFFDRSVHAFTVGEKLYVAQRKTNDLIFVNGQHLWGGKINILAHPKTSTTLGVLPLNLESINGSADYNAKHGQPYYKANSLATGSFSSDSGQLNQYSDDTIISNSYDNKSKLNYYTTNYQFKPNIASDNLIEYDKTDSSYRTMPLDLRGNTTPFGSKSNDTRIHRDKTINLPKLGFSAFLEKQYGQDDDSASRLFLYSVGDILPYSSVRKDSIFNSNITVNNYNLFLMENNKENDGSIKEANRLLLKDSNFQTLGFQDNISLSSLKRFGLMRLTEVCVDFMFNKVNPEKPILKNLTKQAFSAVRGFNITALAGGGSIDTITYSSGGKPIITFDDTQTLADGDELFDLSTGQRIGTVGLTQGGTKKDFQLTASSINLTKNGVLPTDAIKVNTEVLTLTGHAEKDSIIQSSTLHPLKGAIIPEGSTYGTATNDFVKVFTGTNFPNQTDQEIILPLMFLNPDFTNVDASDSTDLLGITNALSHINASMYYGMLCVSLDRFQIEDGGDSPIEKGATSQALKNTISFEYSTFRKYLGITSDSHYAQFRNSGDSSDSYDTSSPYSVDGSYMVFKPRLCIPSHEQTCTTQGNTTLTVADSSVLTIGMTVSGVGINSGTKISSITNTTTIVLDTAATDSATKALTFTFTETDIKSSNGVVKKYTITPLATDGNQFLKMLDITGCYLVPEEGTTLGGTTFSDGSVLSSKRMDNVRPTLGQLVYVISHEVSSSNSDNHFLVTDIALLAGTEYRILQPNETCLFDFFPNKIHLNTLSSSYTKIHNEEKTYSTEQDYTARHGKSAEGGGTNANEGVLSMFVIVDTDKQSTDDGLVLKDVRNFMSTNLPNGEYNMLFSDGDNKKKIQLTSIDANNFSALVLSEGFNGKGVVSVSETFTISSTEELKIQPNRACIGTTVSVGLEGEDLINELLETEGIQFQTTGTDTPMYLAPNYQGVDLYSAINYILDRKDMKIVEENDVFKIVPEDENEYYTNITIDDSGDYLISEFEKQTTLFDFYNEIIAYGSSHKATRKDIRSINKRGRKTLEVVDGSLLTQEEVDKRATKLLKIHSRFNQKLSFTMQNKGINQLRVGDIVTVSLPRENIETGQFIVLEMEHQLVGFIKLQLGRYTKDLSDIFSELLIASKETKSALRSADLVANEISFNFLDTLNTKELKLLVRKREASGGMTFGFGTTLGFTAELGFSGGATITITDLVEEDLA